MRADGPPSAQCEPRLSDAVGLKAADGSANPLTWVDVVGRDGIEPPTLRFSAGYGSSGAVRLSRICPGQQGSRQLAIQGGSGSCGSVQISWAELRQNRARPTCRRHARSWGQRRSASRGLAWQGRPPPAAPDKRAPPATASVGGALAGSGPGTSPCIDGLSLVSGGVPSALLDQTLRTTMAALEQVARRGNAGSTNRPLACKARSAWVVTSASRGWHRSRPVWRCPWLSPRDRS
jgi:hypothetical protein